MTTPVFPALAGQGWSVFRRPKTSTRIATHVSGREVRSQLYVYPLYEFEVSYDGLQHNGAFPNLGEVDALQAFILSVGGPFLPFLYVDPTANTTIASDIATGDGSTTLFTMMRRVGRAYSEPVGVVTGISAVRVYAPLGIDDRGYVANDPVASTTDYQTGSGTLDFGNLSSSPITTPPFVQVGNNQIQFTSPPALGAIIQADFSYAFLCRFNEDVQEFENVMSGLWQMQSLKFSTFR